MIMNTDTLLVGDKVGYWTGSGDSLYTGTIVKITKTRIHLNKGRIFTRKGKEVGSVVTRFPAGQLIPFKSAEAIFAQRAKEEKAAKAGRALVSALQTKCYAGKYFLTDEQVAAVEALTLSLNS